MIRALLFEDDADCREIFTDALSDFDVEVTSFEDPTCFIKDSASCPADSACFDVILTDNQMPHMTGLSFLQRLQEMDCKIPARNKAVISGSLNSAELDTINQLGSKAFHKSCPFSEVYQWLEDVGRSFREVNRAAESS